MNPPIGIGLIGVGRHGSRYLHHLTDDTVPGASLIAVCRRNVDEGLPVTGVRLYGDYRTMLEDPLVEAVVVVTHPSLCPDICLAAAQAGKAMLIEKPLAVTGKDARAMVAAASAHNVVLMTAQTMRYDPTVLRARELLKSIGSLEGAVLVSHIETKAARPQDGRTPVGVLLEFGVHILDLVRWLTEQEVVKVRCSMNASAPHEPETVAKAELQTSGGILCRMDVARVDAGRVGTMKWTGQRGTLLADWPNRKVTRSILGGGTESWTVESRPTLPETLRDFVHAVRSQAPPPITGLDGCRAVEAADACYRSAREDGRWVEVDGAS